MQFVFIFFGIFCHFFLLLFVWLYLKFIFWWKVNSVCFVFYFVCRARFSFCQLRKCNKHNNVTMTIFSPNARGLLIETFFFRFYAIHVIKTGEQNNNITKKNSRIRAKEEEIYSIFFRTLCGAFVSDQLIVANDFLLCIVHTQ